MEVFEGLTTGQKVYIYEDEERISEVQGLILSFKPINHIVSVSYLSVSIVNNKMTHTKKEKEIYVNEIK